MVDLPEPDGPTRNTNSPSSIVKEIPRRASVPLSYVLTTSFKRIISVKTSFVSVKHNEMQY